MRVHTPTGCADRLRAALRRSLLGVAAVTALAVVPGPAAPAPAVERLGAGQWVEASAHAPGPAVRYRRALLRVRGLEAVVRRVQRAMPKARADRRRALAALARRVREIYRRDEPTPLMLLLSSRGLSGALSLASAMERLVEQDLRLLRQLDRTRRRLEALKRMRERALRAARGALREIALQVPEVLHSPLSAIAYCESSNDPTAVSPDGLYRGKYQFDLATWRGVGGTGDPAEAPEAEQDRRAAMLYARRGSQPWPVCGLLFRGVGVETAFSATTG